MLATRMVLVLAAALFVSACSGDSTLGISSSGLNAIAYKVKQLAFSWTAVPAADTYRLLENPDGVSGYSQIGPDFPATTLSFDYDIAVHLQEWSNASYILQSCVGIDCTDTAARTATDSRAAIGYFKASNTDPGDNFGHAIAVSDDGNTIAVGAWLEDGDPAGGEMDDTLLDSGAVYVFTRVAGVWQGPVYIKASNADSNDQFGYSVALSSDGSTLAVGARNEASASVADPFNNLASGSGAVYVFVRAGTGNWTEQGYIKATNVEAGDNFGQAVSLSDNGNILAVGAPGEDNDANIVTNAGAVYTFTRSASLWTQQSTLTASSAAAGDGFGNAISLNATGSVLAIGASLADDAPNVNNGTVYIFTFVANWSETGQLIASNAGTNDNFGTSLALSVDGNTLVVGAPLEDSDGFSDNDNEFNSGAAYIFINNGGWVEQAMLKSTSPGASDQFGISVAIGDLGGNIVAVGADREDGEATGVVRDPQLDTAIDAGAGYLFTREAGVWSQHAYIKSSNTDAGDRFSSTMAMSGDGRTLGVGAIGEDSAANGIGSDQSNNSIINAGAIYLY